MGRSVWYNFGSFGQITADSAHPPTGVQMSDGRRRFGGVRLLGMVALSTVALVAVDHAQGQRDGGSPAGSGQLSPAVQEMQPGQPFHGSLRDRPQTAPAMPERRIRHERDEFRDPPSPLRADTKDPVVQGAGAPTVAAPAPSPTAN